MADDDPYAIAYEEALRLIAGQESALDNLRTRSGTILTISSVATAFLGAEALKRPNALGHAWTWVAIVSFVSLAALTVALVLPYQWGGIYRSPRIIIDGYIECDEPQTAPQIRRNLALHIENTFDEQAKSLKSLFNAFRVTCVLAIVEILAWLFELAR